VLAACLGAAPASASATADRDVESIVAQHIKPVLSFPQAGAVVAVQREGRTSFFTYGWANRAKGQRATPDTLFNLASVSKVFDAALLSLAAERGDVRLDDPVGKYIAELAGYDIGAVTLGQLTSFTSGFTLPQDHPPWPPERYDWSNFVAALREWKRDPHYAAGKQYLYSHAGFLLLHVALERKLGMPYAALLESELLRPLGLSSTTLPARRPNDNSDLPSGLKGRAAQGYSGQGKPIGSPGNVQGYYHWRGTEQMYSSARDLAAFVAALLGNSRLDAQLRGALDRAHQPLAPIRPHVTQALAWEVHEREAVIVGKNGGLNNVSSFVGFVPEHRLGLVILINRGELNAWDMAYPILQRLILENAGR
jgi:beta-lactamase class C